MTEVSFRTSLIRFVFIPLGSFTMLGEFKIGSSLAKLRTRIFHLILRDRDLSWSLSQI